MKIAIIGYGRMGKEIEKIAIDRGHEVVLKINSSNTNDLTKDALSKADLAIEFTGPSSAFANISQCIEIGLPVVSGSTGWLEHKSKVEEMTIQSKSSFLYASNFSLGVNVLFEINRKLAKLLGKNQTYEISISETHHLQKLDAPSGTAITLAKDIIEESHKRYDDWILDEMSENKLSINSERVDGVPGTHKIKYHSAIDDLELSHVAHSRKGFALGAVLAGEFLKDKIGVFSMKDVLNV